MTTKSMETIRNIAKTEGLDFDKTEKLLIEFNDFLVMTWRQGWMEWLEQERIENILIEQFLKMKKNYSAVVMVYGERQIRPAKFGFLIRTPEGEKKYCKIIKKK